MRGAQAGDAARDGRHSAAGTFTVVSSNDVSMNKTVLVLDPLGGNLPVRGATLRYTITVTAAGAGTAQNVVVSDPIPANTTYAAGTLRLNGVPLTDMADLPVPDAGDVGATTPNMVTVKLGNLTSASPVQTIVFDVTIQ